MKKTNDAKRNVIEPHIFNLIQDIKNVLKRARYKAISAINAEMLNAYLEIGRKIVDGEQKGRRRAEYGRRLLEAISAELIKEFGRGYSVTALKNMRKFYHTYKNKISQPATDEFYKLSWTHYCELIKIDDDSKRGYFQKYAITENLSVRDLKRQIYSLHYERLLMSKDKKALIEYEKKSNIPTKSEELIKDPYVLEFLDIGEKHIYTEKQLETRILDNLQKFLLELGQGFSFVGRQKRFAIDNDQFYIDLKELNKKDDNEPIGIILCTEKDKVQIEFALAGISNKLFVSKYKLYLPSKEELEREVKKLLSN